MSSIISALSLYAFRGSSIVSFFINAGRVKNVNLFPIRIMRKLIPRKTMRKATLP